MLDFLRKRKRNWIIVFFLGVIIVTFTLFYGGSKLGEQRTTEVAEVNGELISQREFALHYDREVQRYRDLLKGSLTPEMVKALNIKGNLIETLIQKKLVLQEARNLGLTVTDDDLAEHLGKIPEFQVGGRFNKDRYLQVLQANRLMPTQFEEEQRDQLTIQRLYTVILDAVHAKQGERDATAGLAAEMCVPFLGFWLEAPPAVLRQRVAARSGDVSASTTCSFRPTSAFLMMLRPSA